MIPVFMPARMTLLVFVSVCALSDYQTGRIPNRLILCGLLCAAVSGTQAGAGSTAAMLLNLKDMAAGFLLPYLLLQYYLYLHHYQQLYYKLPI